MDQHEAEGAGGERYQVGSGAAAALGGPCSGSPFLPGFHPAFDCMGQNQLSLNSVAAA